ncbi:hypothetical protein [Burkholderia pseudomultivorans]|uniref:hypothetical protein n=1 Tax=Burkholderia pseudomultivorans TaxID=1207504 RepID=UPI000AEF2BBE|nr:hypothetical protein [Burkholderia pseudomultivorans]
MIPVNGISPFIPIIHVIISLRDTAASITSQSGACAATACQACDFGAFSPAFSSGSLNANASFFLMAACCF